MGNRRKKFNKGDERQGGGRKWETLFEEVRIQGDNFLMG